MIDWALFDYTCIIDIENFAINGTDSLDTSIHSMVMEE
jgi:hypothetical protein